MKNVIITGATGVIGMALIDKCIEEGTRVTVLANPTSNRLSRIPSDNPLVNVIYCGLSEYEAADAASLGLDEEVKNGGYDVFYHLSWGGTFGDARNNMELQRQNEEYTIDALRLAKRLGCRCFVGAGSQAEYGRVEGMLRADTPCNPENGYGICKLSAGIRSRELARELGIRHCWTRVLSIYGPYDGENTMVTSTVLKLLKKEKPSLTGGEQLWDYLYASDAGKALYMVGQSGKDGSIYPVGSGKARKLREYIEIMRDAINPELPLGFGEVAYSDKQVMHLCADISDLTQDTGFTPEIDFEAGIKLTIDFLKKGNPQ